MFYLKKKIVYSIFSKTRLIAAIWLLILATDTLTGNTKPHSGGPVFELVSCGFANPMDGQMYLESEINNRPMVRPGRPVVFWMIIQVPTYDFPDINDESLSNLPMRVKVLRKTSVKYNRAMAAPPIADQRTQELFDRDKKYNRIYAFIDIEDPRGQISVHVVNMRNREINCRHPELCDFELQLPLK